MAPRGMYEYQLRDLQDEILIMGSMVEKAIAHAMEALSKRDFDLAQRLVDDDELINRIRFQIEEKCVTLIATQQPMAGDLRMILSAMSIATDLERIGDYASGIAEITLLLRDNQSLTPLTDLPRMADAGMEMLRNSLKAFSQRNPELARVVARCDDEIDSLYHKVTQLCIIRMSQDPGYAIVGTRIIWVAHKLERIGDRVTNICEQVVFAVTGKMEELDD